MILTPVQRLHACALASCIGATALIYSFWSSPSYLQTMFFSGCYTALSLVAIITYLGILPLGPTVDQPFELAHIASMLWRTVHIVSGSLALTALFALTDRLNWAFFAPVGLSCVAICVMNIVGSIAVNFDASLVITARRSEVICLAIIALTFLYAVQVLLAP